MIVVNLYGGPGIGKSTTAAMLFAHYKRMGLRVELSREVAKEFLYQSRPLGENQVLLSALQYQQLKDYERAGTEVVVTDSPLRLGLAYSGRLPYATQLRELVGKLTREFQEVDVLLKREVPFQPHGREQNENEARELDGAMLDLWAENGDARLLVTGPAPAEVIAAVDPVVLELIK